MIDTGNVLKEAAFPLGTRTCSHKRMVTVFYFSCFGTIWKLKRKGKYRLVLEGCLGLGEIVRGKTNGDPLFIRSFRFHREGGVYET